MCDRLAGKTALITGGTTGLGLATAKSYVEEGAEVIITGRTQDGVAIQSPRMDPDAFLAKIFAATKPGGIVGVVDHVAAPGGDTRAVVRKLHRIDPAKIRADFERAAFKLKAESDLLRNPADDHSKLSLDPAIRGKTDRVIYRFCKPG